MTLTEYQERLVRRLQLKFFIEEYLREYLHFFIGIVFSRMHREAPLESDTRCRSTKMGLVLPWGQYCLGHLHSSIQVSSDGQPGAGSS